jgi:hypothetical protein
MFFKERLRRDDGVLRGLMCVDVLMLKELTAALMNWR